MIYAESALTHTHTQCNKHLELALLPFVHLCVSMVINISYVQQQRLMLLTL